METRASYLLVGSFVLLGVAGLFAFVLWIANAQDEDDLSYYDIFFEGSVAGLGVGGDVRYRGVRIGQVSSIRIDEKDPARVGVRIAVVNPYVLRVGDMATLQLQGVTGVSYVNIEGASSDSAPLEAIGDDPLPVVASAPSQIDKIFAGAPELLAQGNEIAAELRDLFGDDNRQRVAQILSDVETLTGSLARGAPEVERAMVSLGQIAGAANALQSLTLTIEGRAPQLLDNVDNAFAEIAAAAKTADNTIAKVAPTMDSLQLALNDALPSLSESLTTASGSLDQLPALTDELTATSRSVRLAAESARKILNESRGPLAGFMNDGLTELYRFTTEARLLVSGLTRLSDRLEQNGPGFIFRGSNEGFEVK